LRHRRSRREASSTVPSAVLRSSDRDAIIACFRRGYCPAKILDHWWGVSPRGLEKRRIYAGNFYSADREQPPRPSEFGAF
jgi:hypothetical protein